MSQKAVNVCPLTIFTISVPYSVLLCVAPDMVSIVVSADSSAISVDVVFLSPGSIHPPNFACRFLFIETPQDRVVSTECRTHDIFYTQLNKVKGGTRAVTIVTFTELADGHRARESFGTRAVHRVANSTARALDRRANRSFGTRAVLRVAITELALVCRASTRAVLSVANSTVFAGTRRAYGCIVGARAVNITW